MANVAYIPGLLGSNLAVAPVQGDALQTIWIDFAAILHGQLAYLQLGANGIAPGPLAGGRNIVPSGIVRPAYGELSLVMLLAGHTVLEVAVDWRKSVLTSAPDVLRRALQRFGADPFWLVTHSQGGLVARAVYGVMSARGIGSQVLGLIQICPPNYGSFAIVRLFNHLPMLYKALVLATGWKGWVPGLAGPPYLDAVLASMPGLYELLPFAASGPLFTRDPAQAKSLYQISTYSSGNPFVSPDTLFSAEAVQSVLAGYALPPVLRIIAGTGQKTAYSLAPSSPANDDKGYIYTQDGDNTVTADEAALPGAVVASVAVNHELACVDPRVWALVLNFLAA